MAKQSVRAKNTSTTATKSTTTDDAQEASITVCEVGSVEQRGGSIPKGNPFTSNIDEGAWQSLTH